LDPACFPELQVFRDDTQLFFIHSGKVQKEKESTNGRREEREKRDWYFCRVYFPPLLPSLKTMRIEASREFQHPSVTGMCTPTM
jgi:hypothetical protein